VISVTSGVICEVIKTKGCGQINFKGRRSACEAAMWGLSQSNKFSVYFCYAFSEQIFIAGLLLLF